MKVAIVGAGISGLALAHHLQELAREKKSPLEINIFEASDHLGGVISSIRKQGFLLESGPDSFISEKPWALDLVRRLGLESEIIRTREGCRKSFVVRNGKLLPVPEGFYLIAPVKAGPFLASRLFSWPAKFRMALEALIPAKKNSGEDESVAQFIRRRFGHEALERVGEAMVAGIYTSDPESLSLKATFPKFLELEQKYGSVTRGLSRMRGSGHQTSSGPRYSLFLSLKEGMQSLVDALAKSLPKESIHLGARIDRILKQDSWIIESCAGKRLCADILVLTQSVPGMSELVTSFDQELAGELAEIPCHSVATLNLAYRREQIRHVLDGFGFVVPRQENLSMVGCTFSSIKFPGRAPEGHVLLRAFLRGGRVDEAKVQRELGQLLVIQGEPVFSHLSEHVQAMPQYQLGHLERANRIGSLAGKHEGLFLAGNAFRGIGIPDCIHEAEKIAEKIYVSFPCFS